MIAGVIKQLCAMSLLCGAAMSIAPEGTVKRVLEIVCSVVLLTAVVRPLIGMDFTAYALQLAKFEEKEEEFLDQSADLNDRLNRLVIEEKYETYIMDKAEEQGVGLDGVQVTVEWNMEGFWVPYSVQLDCRNESGREALSGILEAELGIPAERQQWSCDGKTKD